MQAHFNGLDLFPLVSFSCQYRYAAMIGDAALWIDADGSLRRLGLKLAFLGRITAPVADVCAISLDADHVWRHPDRNDLPDLSGLEVDPLHTITARGRNPQVVLAHSGHSRRMSDTTYFRLGESNRLAPDVLAVLLTLGQLDMVVGV